MIFWFWTRPAINAKPLIQTLAAQLGISTPDTRFKGSQDTVTHAAKLIGQPDS